MEVGLIQPIFLVTDIVMAHFTYKQVPSAIFLFTGTM